MGVCIDLRIDDANHTSLAMLCLGAVIPHRLGILDRNGECRNHRRIRRRGHKPREEPRDVRHDIVDGFARVREGGLHDGVVLGVKLELDD